MKKKNVKKSLCFFLFIVMLGAFHALEAQVSQAGRVLLYHGSEAKSALSDVAISAAGAPAVVSDAEGQFTLKFRTLHEGDAIQFRRIELSGYEVMNQEALEVARVANSKTGSSVLTIVMCKSDELAQLRDGYRTTASQRYQQQYEASQRQLQKLQEEGKIKQEEYNRQLDELEGKYEAQLQTLDTYVDKFARIDLSELDEFEKEIIALVQEGRFDEAIAKYEAQNLTERLQKTVQEQNQLGQDVQRVEQSIDAKKQEAERLEKNINKQIDLLQKVGGNEAEQKIDELNKVLKEK